MAPIEFPPDFSEFLRLLDDHRVEFMMIGGFAVALYGYPRATADLGIWMRRHRDNSARMVECLRAFGFDAPNLNSELSESPDVRVRMGVAPLRIEILTAIDGVEFDECAPRAVHHVVSGVSVQVSRARAAGSRRRGRPGGVCAAAVA